MTRVDIRAWRQRLGMTQKQAAEALGISERAIRAYERGDYEPRPTAQRLMAAVEREAQRDNPPATRGAAE